MKKATFQNPIFQDETKAREALEAVRWPEGPVCPHCGNADAEKIAKVAGTKQSHRPGLFVAGGQYRNGILFAPAIARMMADIIMGHGAETPEFDPRRFK